MVWDIVARIMQAIHDWWVAALVIATFVGGIILTIYEKKINGDKLYFEIEAEKKAKKAAKEEKKRRKEAQRWWYQ